jgi:hypothetical protein
MNIQFPRLLIVIVSFIAVTAPAADLPTISLEHLYYLQTRAECVRKFKGDDMVDYCLAQKIGGSGFENLYTQIFSLRTEATKLLRIEEVKATDPRILLLNRSIDAYTALLREEAEHVKNGILKEGKVAEDTLTAIAKAQNQQ